ncbi:MAG: hypothetical protein KDJ17_01400 [Hyphomicrobiaceae bacterium]|nr:hypothetical protein [Hyphomicrobiaceae bacterium]
MNPLVALGQLMPLDELARELKHRIAARGLGPPRAFERLADQILVDHPDSKALVLSASTTLPSDVSIDYEGLAEHGIATVAVLGDFSVQGRLINADSEGGPYFFVDGDLTAGEIVKGGAGFVILGSVTCRGILFCDYNHGTFLVGKDLSAAAIITCDSDLHAGGDIKGPIISDELGNMREMLVPEVFEDPDDPQDDFVDADLVRARLEAGQPVLKV